MPASDDSTFWRVVDDALVIRHWHGEPECVAFSPRSGDVHLLSLAAGTLLEELIRQPQRREALATRLAAATSRTVDNEWMAAIDEALTMLDSAGLIEPRVP